MNAARPLPQEPSYADRLEALRRQKEADTREKQSVKGAMDHDDHGVILPPPDRRKMVETMSTSGMPITDVLMSGFEPEETHPDGGFFGPRACGENYRRLLEAHPPYIHPMSSLAGAYMVTFASYRAKGWPRERAFQHLAPAVKKYRLVHGIGGMQHFCQDLAIGLELGWGGLLHKIRTHALRNPAGKEYYAGLEAVVLGVQDWIRRTAAEARRKIFDHPAMTANLESMAEMNEYLVDGAPRTFREACQWILWYQVTARMYNGSGSLGRLDLLLQPFYDRDVEAGLLDDEEAVFHIACLLLRDPAYMQLGGPTAEEDDVTGPVSYLVLEAAHRLRIPANVGVCVGAKVDPGLLRRGVEIMLEDRTGIPKFLGVDNTVAGFVRNGFPESDARERAYSGCHWSAIPGREYAIMDCIKIDFAAVFEIAFAEVMDLPGDDRSVERLWDRFAHHLREAVRVEAECIDFHVKNMEHVFPELVLSLLCHGTIEKGLDASAGGVEYYTFGLDGAALATVADSFAAIQVRVDEEKKLGWDELAQTLADDFAGPGGERIRLMLHSVPRYGSGGSAADGWADRISRFYSALVVEKPTPDGHRMIPGLFSWANTIPMGAALGATPNGRHKGAPINHGVNPEPGFRVDGAPTAMAEATARVQPGYGNTAPLQLDLEPTLTNTPGDVDKVMALIQGHFALGGTQINLNLVDRETILQAHENPEAFPDLVVRVTGFSAYFASLSPEFRRLVVERIVQETA